MDAKAIEFNYNGIDYKLEFTKGSILQMEKDGFTSDLADKPMTFLSALWEGSFLAHHRGTKKDLMWKIYEGMGDKSELLKRLSELYAIPIQFLTGESEGEQISWT